jgi:hypothetical protein
MAGKFRANKIDEGGIEGAITVGTSAVEAKVGASQFTNRQLLTVQHKGNQRLFWGFTPSVTVSSGTEIFKDQSVTFEIQPEVKVYLISNQAGQNVRITEAA